MKKETRKRVTKKYNKSISGDLIGDIRGLIEIARHNVAVTVNAGLTILYWQIGNRIRQVSYSKIMVKLIFNLQKGFIYA